jgi:(p)ppGpp synthase/HD superfamily hydrolase
MPPSEPPDFLARSELLGRAYRFALDAHEGERSQGTTRIDHPTAVARLLIRHGAGDRLVAAAFLHDVLEDTTVTREELEVEFGAEIAELVADLTEDPAIEAYADRKAHLREQVAEAGEEAATIFLADKLASLQRLEATGQQLPQATLAHYRETLVLLARTYPDLSFIADVRHALRNAGQAGDS